MAEDRAPSPLRLVPSQAGVVIDWMDLDALTDARTLREMMDAMTDAERRAFRARAEMSGLLPSLRSVHP